MVVAGKPRGGTVGLPRHQHAFGQLLETDLTPDRPDGSWRSAVPDDDRHRRTRRQRRRQRDVQLAARTPEPRRAPPVHRHLRHRERIGQIQRKGSQRRERRGGDRGRSGEPVGCDLVLQIEFVARNPVAEIARMRQVRIDHRDLLGRLLRTGHAADSSVVSSGGVSSRFLRNAFHGAIGLPCQRVDGGTSSPRITNEAGPTVAPAPRRAAGSATQCGPNVEPCSSTTVSIRITRSWNRCVCTTQPRLTVAPFSSVTRSASGSQ